MKGCLQISGYHDTIETWIEDGSVYERPNYDHDSSNRRSIRRIRFLQPFLVYCIIAVLSFAGGAGWQYQAHPVGGNSSFNYSHRNWVGSLAQNGGYHTPDSVPSNIGPFRGRIRIYDSPPGISRHLKHLRHERHVNLVVVVPSVQPVRPPPTYVPPPGRQVYNCRQLENLWISQGGNPNAAFIAAEIATAESGGRVYIVSPTDDYGLWQINWTHDPLDPDIYLNPVVNVRAAIAISADGTNWTAWTTWVKGLYIGLC